MTITLDQIRDTKFHVSKRNGYEVTEVDRFVDQVEEAFAQITEENNSLKKQVDALKSAQANAERASKAQEQPSPEETTQEQTRVVDTPAPAAPTPAATPAPAAVAQAPASTVDGGVERIVVTTTPEASAAVVRLVQLHTEQVETMENEARADAKQKIDQANAQAKQITDDAKARANKVETDAKGRADQVMAEAQRGADDLGRQVDTRRAELFRALEGERDELQSAVNDLRAYEQRYRASFTEQLRSTLESVQGASIEPDDAPSLAKRSNNGEAGGASGSRSEGGTPRLDALLGENRG